MSLDRNGTQLLRLRQLSLALPETLEKLSHSTPNFYVGKKPFALYSDDHHGDGKLAAWIKAPPGVQELLLISEPERIFRPAYVGPYGWIGVHLRAVDDDELAAHLLAGWRMVAPKKLLAQHPAG